MAQVVASRSCWLLVHPDGRVQWSSLDFREDRPGGLFVLLTKWRWQRWILRADDSDSSRTQDNT
jgi:hypothetical protein